VNSALIGQNPIQSQSQSLVWDGLKRTGQSQLRIALRSQLIGQFAYCLRLTVLRFCMCHGLKRIDQSQYKT